MQPFSRYPGAETKNTTSIVDIMKLGSMLFIHLWLAAGREITDCSFPRKHLVAAQHAVHFLRPETPWSVHGRWPGGFLLGSYICKPHFFCLPKSGQAGMHEAPFRRYRGSATYFQIQPSFVNIFRAKSGTLSSKSMICCLLLLSQSNITLCI